jgi:hypothetical protein
MEKDWTDTQFTIVEYRYILKKWEGTGFLPYL